MAEQNDGLEKSDAMAFYYSTLENQPGIVIHETGGVVTVDPGINR